MLSLPNVKAAEKPLILEEYAKRIFDAIYDPTIGKFEKPFMNSRIGDVLKFFGISELKSPIRDKVFDELYGLVDQTGLDSDNKKMVKETLKAAMKQHWDKNHLPENIDPTAAEFRHP